MSRVPRRLLAALVLLGCPAGPSVDAGGTAGSTGATGEAGDTTAASTGAPADSTGATTGAPGDSTGATAGAPAVEYWLPLLCGTTAPVGQGNHGEFSHTGERAYAFDILLDRGTPVISMAAGTVLYTFDETRPGDPCHDGGDESCVARGNLVVLGHADGTTSLYKHLDEVRVAVGAELPRGALLGLSGATGWATVPHLHVMRMDDCGSDRCQSIPLAFVEVGVPHTGDDVTSMNCP